MIRPETIARRERAGQCIGCGKWLSYAALDRGETWHLSCQLEDHSQFGTKPRCPRCMEHYVYLFPNETICSLCRRKMVVKHGWEVEPTQNVKILKRLTSGVRVRTQQRNMRARERIHKQS